MEQRLQLKLEINLILVLLKLMKISQRQESSEYTNIKIQELKEMLKF